MNLHELTKQTGLKSKKKIIGRGIGSGVGGHTVGKGMNGQRSRSGGNKMPSFDFAGGQARLSRALPKLRGFNSIKNTLGIQKLIVQASDVDANFNDGDTVTIAALQEKGLIKNIKGKRIIVKVLNGKVQKKLTFDGVLVTK